MLTRWQLTVGKWAFLPTLSKRTPRVLTDTLYTMVKHPRIFGKLKRDLHQVQTISIIFQLVLRLFLYSVTIKT